MQEFIHHLLAVDNSYSIAQDSIALPRSRRQLEIGCRLFIAQGTPLLLRAFEATPGNILQLPCCAVEVHYPDGYVKKDIFFLNELIKEVYTDNGFVCAHGTATNAVRNCPSWNVALALISGHSLRLMDIREFTRPMKEGELTQGKVYSFNLE